MPGSWAVNPARDFTNTMSEFELIDWIRQRIPAHKQVPLGIGDDAALLKFRRNGEALVTVDMLMEGTHFTLNTATPFQIGWKSLGVNLSDIAAMGGRAVAAVVAIALPRHNAWDLAQGIQSGIDTLAKRFDVCIAGGDTNTWNGPLVISITAFGEPLGKGPVRRGGAQAGDWILVTGELGGSLSSRHLDFVPRLEEARLLQESSDLHSMIDISDGLAADLHHILEESRVGARVFVDRIPISEAARHRPDRLSALEHALGDGEDFELLMTLGAADAAKLLANPPFQTRLSHIGEITAHPGCQRIEADGSASPLGPLGWRHPFQQ
ncbi:MAG: thiL [Planctomycetaceae bacterium]|nr:thiL [Planctomycetaceae bacterium]